MGIGTFLTNKIVRKAGKPLNQVIKLTSVDFGSGFKDIVKISDDIGKITGNEELVKIAKYYIK
jgi:nicotinic acid phosphoribosyltransferase